MYWAYIWAPSGIEALGHIKIKIALDELKRELP